MSLLISTIQEMWLLPLPLRDNSIIQQLQCQEVFHEFHPKCLFSNFIPFLIVTPDLSTSLNDFLFPMRVTLLNIWRTDIFYFYLLLSQELYIYHQQNSFFSQSLYCLHNFNFKFFPEQLFFC